MTGRELKTTLRRVGLSQMAFARQLKVAPSTVRRWIAGRSAVPEAIALLLTCWIAHPKVRSK
jgi:DNA-binding transcriptional regulator YiaG